MMTSDMLSRRCIRVSSGSNPQIKYQTEKEVVDGLYLQEASIRQAQVILSPTKNNEGNGIVYLLIAL